MIYYNKSIDNKINMSYNNNVKRNETKGGQNETVRQHFQFILDY